MKSILYCKLLLLVLEFLTIITNSKSVTSTPLKKKKDLSLQEPRIASENSLKAAKLLKLVVFSFDGFRNDYVNSVDTPNLYALAQDGVRGHMRSTMVTKTYPNHQSIVTGLYQPYHGIVNNEFTDPESPSGHFDVDSPSSFWWDMNNRSVPMYIANQLYEPEVRFSGAMQWPGSIASYTDGTGNKGSNRSRVHYLQDYDKSMNWISRVDLTIDWLLDPIAPANLAFVYIPEPDSTAHEFGPFSEQVKEQVKLIDVAVGYFRRRIFDEGLSHRTNVIFLSDHGMAEVRSDRVFHIEQCEKKLYPGLRFKVYGVSPVYSLIADAAPVSTLSKNENISVIDAVKDALNRCAEKLFAGNFKVYRSNDTPTEYHYSGNRRLLDLFLVAKNGYDVIVGDNGGWKPKGYPVWGNHGYNASVPDMRPLFVAQGPRFRSGGYVHPTVFENVDLYPLMAHLIGIPVDRFPSNGSFARVRGMLSKTLYDVDGDDYLRSHLAKDHQPSLEKSLKWIHLLIYIGVGFGVIFTLGACFVLTAGFSGSSTGSRKTSKTSSILGGSSGGGGSKESSNLFSALFGRFGRRRTSSFGNHGLRGQHYSCQYTSQRHLDSSFDTEEEEEEDELFNQQVNNTKKPEMKKKKPPRRTPNNDITEVDWDIMGTGLDIDLASQLAPSLMRNGNSRSYRDASPQTSESSPPSNQQLTQKSKEKEFTSLLISEEDEDQPDELYYANGIPKHSKSFEKVKSEFPLDNEAFDDDEDFADFDDDGLTRLGTRSTSTKRLIDFP